MQRIANRKSSAGTAGGSPAISIVRALPAGAARGPSGHHHETMNKPITDIVAQWPRSDLLIAPRSAPRVSLLDAVCYSWRDLVMRMKPRLLSRRLQPDALASSPPPWADVLSAFYDAVAVTDGDARIVLFNPAAEELIGQPRGRVLGEPCARVFGETPLIAEMVARVLAQGQSESRSEEQLHRRERSIPVRVTCLPLFGRDDRVSGVAVVIHDLGYQKTLEEAARRNESLARLGTMVTGLAHEVRNPLAGIKGAAQLLEARIGAQPDLREYTAVITREVNRLSSLVEDLLTLGAPPKPRLAPLNIHRVIQQVVAVIAPEIAWHGIRLQYGFDPSLPDVLADEAQLHQVFLNILRNACEAMTNNGPAAAGRNVITLSTRMETDFHILHGHDRASTFLRVEIGDQGAGIDPETAAQMFEPFFTTKARGTGLGLAISQRIVAEHGGIIRATPQHPLGTVITVTLPVPRR
jgi:two-component system nitrogen regulation sensor histidine kinase GlnL